MTPEEFNRLETLIRSEVGGLRSELGSEIDGLRSEIGGLRSDFGERLKRLEIGQEQLHDDLRGVAEGVTMNGERLDRANARIDGVDSLVRQLAGLKPASD